MYEPGSDGVVWWEDYADEARHRPTAGLLDRCRATETCPKIVETFGSAEFFNLRASARPGRHARRSRHSAPVECPPLLLSRA